MNSIPFSAMLDSRIREGPRVRFAIPPAWLQGRTTFGGLIAAQPALWPDQPAALRTADATPPVPQKEGVTPAFLRHFDMRWAAGALPCSGRLHWNAQLHLRLLDPAGVPLGLQAVLLADAPPTPVLGSMSQRSPASSVTWALELRPLVQALAADALWRIDITTVVAADGHVNQRAMLWAPDGQLSALAYQVVAVYG